MARCVVFGASGQIGRFLLPALAAAGHEVLAISRQPRDAGHGVHWREGNLDTGVPALGAPEVLFSLGPLDAFARWFERGPELRPRRIIAFGSMSIDSKRGSADAAERELVDRLQAAEATLATAAAARGAQLTLFRPTLIYGAGLDRSLAPIARFACRWRVFPLLPAASGLRQPVHAEDLAGACMAVLDLPQAFGRTYALGGGERLGFAAMLERLRAALPVRTLPLPLPLGLLRRGLRAGAALGLPSAGEAALARLRLDLVADHSAAVADFGWAPRPFRPAPAGWQVPPPR
ncbi:MAG: hypothetical protein J0H15_03340 [Xanthomonadales bacterium]|nr:hypothetical protein [Xanthomonadales bacterium]